MPATREDLVKIAREAVGGLHRPAELCEATGTHPWGESFTMQVACEHSVRNPASYDPPEWVLEAMQRAYERGRRDGAELAVPRSPTKPRAEDIDDIREHG